MHPHDPSAHQPTEPRIPLGIGHLTMLDVSPPDLVSAAAAAGFDFVGVRTCIGGPGEDPWLPPGSPLIRETLQRAQDTGITITDADVLPIRDHTVAADYEAVFEVTAQLGARYMIVFVEDDDVTRSRDTLAELSRLGAPYGVRLLIEPMSYKHVATIGQARDLLGDSGAGIMVDPLHIQRAGDDWDLLAELGDLTPVIQFCDGPLRRPTLLPSPGPLPRGQLAGTNLAQLEARAARLPAGQGELPLRRVLDLLPGRPISIEAPNLELSRTLDPTALAALHLRSLRNVLQQTGLRSRRA